MDLLTVNGIMVRGTPQGCRHKPWDLFSVRHADMDGKIVRHAVIVVKNDHLTDFWIPTPTSDFSHIYVRHGDFCYYFVRLADF